MMRNAPDLSCKETDILVVQARSGNDQAFAELVKRHQSGLRNLLRRLSNDSALADDLAQQAFFEAWRSIRNLRSAPAFGAWLKRLAINTWLKHFRSKDPMNAIDDKPEMPVKVDRLFTIEKIDIDRALSTLPAQVRLCVILSYHQGMSHEMIAEFAGMPLGTIKSHIKRGVQQLRQILSVYESEISSGNSGNQMS